MTKYKMVNGVSIELTAAEEAARVVEEARTTKDLQDEIDAKTAKTNNKASGKQKLKDLGLDDNEIEALVG
jgi:hypothetical protein